MQTRRPTTVVAYSINELRHKSPDARSKTTVQIDMGVVFATANPAQRSNPACLKQTPPDCLAAASQAVSRSSRRPTACSLRTPQVVVEVGCTIRTMKASHRTLPTASFGEIGLMAQVVEWGAF